MAVVVLAAAVFTWRRKSSRSKERFTAAKEVELRQFQRMADANSNAYAKPNVRIGRDSVSSNDFV